MTHRENESGAEAPLSVFLCQPIRLAEELDRILFTLPDDRQDRVREGLPGLQRRKFCRIRRGVVRRQARNCRIQNLKHTVIERGTIVD